MEETISRLKEEVFTDDLKEQAINDIMNPAQVINRTTIIGNLLLNVITNSSPETGAWSNF